mmetsp:Transcript_13901/g.13527  ORF Transcript_13901/g.13527 Transcript_13901/m.13527 type:complete len:161 (+) Transcript_13901:347-829(+)
MEEPEKSNALNEILFSQDKSELEDEEFNIWKSQQVQKLNFSNINAYQSNNLMNKRRIHYSQDEDKIKEKTQDDYCYSDDDPLISDEELLSSRKNKENFYPLASLISYNDDLLEGRNLGKNKIQVLDCQKNRKSDFSNESNDESPDDGRIMAYLEKIETAR